MSNCILNFDYSVRLFFARTAGAMLLSIPLFAQSGVLMHPTITYDAGVPCINDISVGDFNADGNADVALAVGCTNFPYPEKSTGGVAVLLGKGNGTFRTPIVWRSGGLVTVSVQVGDVNGDRKLDLLTANSCATAECKGGTIGVLLGEGDGSFASPTTIPTARNFGVIASADLNGDGKLDIVNSSCSTGCTAPVVLKVRLGNGDGTFQSPAEYAAGYPIHGIAISDLNRDGKLDIVVSRPCRNQTCAGEVSVVLGSGEGTFGSALDYDSGGEYASGLTVSDVDNDGNLDVIVVNACPTFFASGLGILLGNGDGTLQPAQVVQLPAPTASSVVGADLNGDHHTDLFVAHCTRGYTYSYSCPGGSGVVVAMFGSSDGTFSASVLRSSGGIQAIGLAIADVNSDGKSDILVANSMGESNGNGTLGVILHSNDALKTTSLAVTSNFNPSLVRQSVTLTASVISPSGLIPNGELVTFFDGLVAVGIAKTVGGVASFTTSVLSPIEHTVKAIYSGDANFRPSAGTVKQLVQKYPSAASLTSSANPSVVGQHITLTCKVTSSAPDGVSGKVRFLDGTTGIGTSSLNNGVAVLSTAKLSPGTHGIITVYLGDDLNAKASSTVLNQVVH